jgi:hypothetical protein
MFNHRWYQSLDRPTDPDSIKAEAERCESRYWTWFVISIAFVGAGLAIFFISFRDDTSLSNLGLFLVLVGLIDSVLIKIWAHVMMSTLRLALLMGKK